MSRKRHMEPPMRQIRGSELPPVESPMGREEVVREAYRIVRLVESRGLPKGARLVVVVTGEDGEWVGVSSNKPNDDVVAILESALHGADLKYHDLAIEVPAENH